MRIFGCLALISLLLLPGCSAPLPPESPQQSNKIRVYLLGSFHFDQVHPEYDVLESQHQQSLEALTKLISAVAPEKVFLERQPEFDSTNGIREYYRKFRLAEETTSKVRNEFWQVGFRVARELGHEEIFLCDHPGRFGALSQHARESADKLGQLDVFEGTAPGVVQSIESRTDEEALREELSLLDYLRWLNGADVHESSHGGYLSTYPLVGSPHFYDYDDDDTLIGAEVLTDWYRRNILIYTKILGQLTFDESALLVVIGNDHVPDS